MNPVAIDIVSAFRTFHSKVLSFESETFQTIFMKTLGSSKNHVFVFRNPVDISLNDLGRRVAVLNVVSDERSKRRHKPSKQKVLLYTTTRKNGKMREISPARVYNGNSDYLRQGLSLGSELSAR